MALSPPQKNLPSSKKSSKEHSICIPVEVKALSLLFQPVLLPQNPRVTSIPLEAFQLRPEASWQKKVLHSHWS